MQPGQKIRFTKEVRNGPFKKGSIAEIVQELAPGVYIISFKDEEYWALVEDFEPWNQLSLFG